VESIAKVVSVDIVTEAAAGGSIEHMIASNREGDEDMDWENVTLEALKEARPDLVEAILAQAKSGAETVLSELKEAVKKTEQENVQLREAVARFEARAIIAEKVAASNLPAPAQARVRQLLESIVPLKDGALDTQVLETRIAEAIKAEQDYLAQVAGNPVRGAGAAGGAGNLEEALKKTESAMDRLFGIKTGGEK
jgi:exonuclease VII small subunit